MINDHFRSGIVIKLMNYQKWSKWINMGNNSIDYWINKIKYEIKFLNWIEFSIMKKIIESACQFDSLPQITKGYITHTFWAG